MTMCREQLLKLIPDHSRLLLRYELDAWDAKIEGGWNFETPGMFNTEEEAIEAMYKQVTELICLT